MEKNELKTKIYAKVDELPTLPAVLPKLMGLMEDERSSGVQVADTISKDPALTSKILKVANSAYYGFPQEVSTLERAVPLLGYNMVRSLALSIGVIDSLPYGKSSSHFSREGLWVHGLAVATVMHELGKRLGQGGDEKQYFVVGLLHDIGKFVLDLFFNELFQKSLEEAHTRENMALYAAENEIIGFDHGVVGGILLTRWRFPEAIIQAITFHHHSSLPDDVSSTDVAMLRIADTLPQEINLGGGGNPVIPEISEADLEQLKMTEQDLHDLRSYLINSKDGIHALFSSLN